MKNFNSAWLTTNRTCNNSCDWCYAKNTLNSHCMMSFEEAKIAVDELCRRGVKRVILIGGEPTIYPHFFELAKYIKSKKMTVSVPSNGRRFKNLEFAKRAKDAEIDNIDISIKALTEEEYHKNTHSYGLQEMIDGYHNLKKVGVHVTSSYVIVSDDTNEFDKLVEFLEKNEFSMVALQFVKPTLELGKENDIMSIKQMGNMVNYIYNRMKNSNVDYVLEISFPICLIDPEVFDNLTKEHKVINCCHVPRGTGINIDENFKIIPCNHFAEFPFSDKPVDFSNPDSLDEIMESDIVKEFREKTQCYPAEKCATCDKWNICGGGCFTRWLSVNPNDYIK